MHCSSGILNWALPPGWTYRRGTESCISTGWSTTDLVREEAESIALQAHGVKKVVNSLGVTNAGR